MKKILFSLCMLCMSLNIFAQTRQGDQSVGLNLGYAFDSENVTLGIDYRYNVTDEIRLAPSFTHFIKNNGLSASAIDLNVHYLIPLSDVLGFYPLAGVDLSFWQNKYVQLLDGYFEDNFTRVGVNLGLGAEIYATDELSVGLEVKYNIIKDFDQALVGLRVAYNF